MSLESKWSHVVSLYMCSLVEIFKWIFFLNRLAQNFDFLYGTLSQQCIIWQYFTDIAKPPAKICIKISSGTVIKTKSVFCVQVGFSLISSSLGSDKMTKPRVITAMKSLNPCQSRGLTSFVIPASVKLPESNFCLSTKFG